MTSLITVTTTAVASICPTEPISNTVPLVSSTGVSNTSVKTPTYSSQPTISPIYDLSSFSGLPQDGAHMAESSISSLPVMSLSQYNTTIDNELIGNGADSSQSSFPMAVIPSSNVLSTSKMNTSTLRNLATGFSSKNSGGLLPMRKPTPFTTERPTGPLRAASISHFTWRRHATVGHDDAQQGSDRILPSHGPPEELSYLARVTGSPRHL